MAGNVMKSTIAVAGEAEYKKAIKACKDALSEMKAELEFVSASFANDAKSMEASRAKLEALRNVQAAYDKQLTEEAKAIEIAAKNVEYHKEQIAKLRDEVSKATQNVSDLTKSHGKESEEVKKANETLEAYEKTLKQHEKSLSNAETKETALRTQHTKTQTELVKLNGEIENTKKALQEADKPADDFAGSLKEVGDSANKSANGIDLTQIASSALGKMLTAGGVIKALDMLKDAFDEVISASREYESAFAGVLKTVNASQEELDALRQDILDLSNEIPMTATEIAGIAEAAGQLGIKTEDIIGFSETMAKLGVATDVTAESAATLLAQFAKVTDMDPSNYDRLGSTIVDLGNNFATTESKIIDMAQRLAGAGATVGLSQADILGVAAALSSLGIEAEAGGSAVSKLLKKIETATKTYGKANEIIKETGLSVRELELLQDQDAKTYKALAEELNITTAELTEYREAVKGVTQYAEVSNMTAEEFIRAWGEDAVGALVSFTQGLGDTERTGQSAIEILNEMGITEVRMSDAVLRLANSGETLVEAQEMANKAWDENIALQVEAEKRFETTDSKVQLLTNAFETQKILIGDQLKPAYDWVVEGLTNIINAVNEAIGAEVDFKNTYLNASEEMRTAAEDEVQHARDVRDALEETTGKITEHQGKVETLISRIEELGSKDHLTAQEEDELRKALEELNKIMPTTAGYYMDLASGSKEAAQSVRDLLAAEIAEAKFQANKEAYIAGQASLEAMSSDLEGLTKQYNKLSEERSKLQEELKKTPSMNHDGSYTSEYLAVEERIRKINDEMSNLGSTIQKTKVAQQSLSLTQNKLLDEMESYKESAAGTAKAVEEATEVVERMTDETVNAKAEANKQLSALDRIRQLEAEAAAEKEAAVVEKAAQKASASVKAAKDAEAEAEAKAKAKQKALEERYRMTDDTVNAEGNKNQEKRQKELEAQLKADEKAVKEYEDAIHKYAASKGSYFPKDVAKSIKSNSGQVTEAVQTMLTEAGNAMASTAQKVGKQIADEITMSMQEALQLGNALSSSIAQGKLTVGNNTVKGVGQYTLSELGLEVDPAKYNDWLEAMYAKGFDRSLSGAEIAKMLNTGIGVSSPVPGVGTSGAGAYEYEPYDEAAAMEIIDKLAAGVAREELGLTSGTSPLSDAMEAAYNAQFTARQLASFASIDQNKINRERGWYEIGGQKYDYYTNEPISNSLSPDVNIVNNFNTEVETPATAAKKIQEAVEAALYQ